MEENPELRNILVSRPELGRLIENLYVLTGIRVNLISRRGTPIPLPESGSPFCRAIYETEEGAARCRACCLRAIQACQDAGNPAVFPYTCHVGLRSFLLPVPEEGVPVAYLLFSSLRADVSWHQQWEWVHQSMDWFSGNSDPIMGHFSHIKQCSSEELTAFSELLMILIKYIRQEDLIRTAEYTDRQKLCRYLDDHYMEPLSLQSISSDLHMGSTKLCALAKELSGGKTMTHLISTRRVHAAEKLLISSSIPISDVAGKVGFADYNYFTRIFKAHTGMTPRNFRKIHLQQLPREFP